ncbi:MAG TPA: class I SAM-dependent methyltransferase [Candidatus Omnitrophota bacterium]|nr:class I SAM-dependent methyltransferase [Candidatus Omnitrophota bacterium]
MRKDQYQRHNDLIVDQFTKQAIPFSTRPSHSEYLDLIMELTKVTSNDTVLDVACGPGLVSCAFAATAKHVTGIDLVPAMIERAKVLQQDKKLSNLTWKTGDALPLPFPDGSFSIVITRYSFHHLMDPLAVWKEMTRVAKSEGRVAVIDVFTSSKKQAMAYDQMEKLRDSSHVRALRLEELQRMATKTGLIRLEKKFYRLEIPLEQQLKESFPESSEDADKIRKMVSDDVGKDTLGVQAQWKDKELYVSIPVAIIVGIKS